MTSLKRLNIPLSGTFAVLVGMLCTTVVQAEDAGAAALPELDAQQAVDACRRLEHPDQRLACYDRIQGVSVTGGRYEPESTATTIAIETQSEMMDDAVSLAAEDVEIPLNRSRMMREWELDDATDGGVLRIRTHESVYALPARYSSDPNDLPSSPAPGRTVTESLNLDAVEAKFQLSLKTKLFDNVLGDNGDIWFGYTQQSSWQAYNTIESSPFRETQYAPEIFATLRTGIDLPFGWRWQMVNFGFLHQSNGFDEPRSRSWNRWYAQFGFENNGWELFIRPWSETDTDDNPDIRDYFGRADIRLQWHRSKHDFGLTGRYAADDNRGAVQFDWHYPLWGDLKAYLQVFHGYGETLIDYNHRQTTVGVGISLVQ